MKSFCKVALAASGLAMTASPAAATVFLFSAELDSGPNTGSLTGSVDLSFVSFGGSGSGSASAVNIFTTPAGITLPEGSEAVNWTNQLENSFTVTGGAVTSFAFFALTGAGGSAATELCLNDGAASFDALNRACPAGLNFIGTGGATEFGFNFDGSDGISFTAIAPSVPEPATWAFMIFGFGTIGGAMRRQRKVNVKVSYA